MGKNGHPLPPFYATDSILDHIAEHAVIHDLNHEIIWLNKAAYESVNATRDGLIGRHCYEIWQGRDEPCIGCPVVKGIETGISQTAEIKSPDERYWLIRSHPLRDDHNNIIGAVELTYDITAQKNAELELAKREESYRNIYNSALVGFWRSRIDDGTLLKLNPAAVRALGYDSEEEVIGKIKGTLFYTPEERERFLRQLLEKGEISSFETRLTIRDGSQVDVLMSGRIYPEKGYIEGVIINITERKKFEEALRLSEKKYRELYENMREGSAEVDMDGRIVECNTTFRKMLGYGPEEIMALTYRDITPSKWHPIEEVILNDQVLRRGYSDTYEKEYIRKNGTTFPVELRTYLIRSENGVPSGMWAIVRDITERRRSELMILRSEKKYRDLVENISEGMCIIDHNENFLFVNLAACEIFGYSREEIMGMNVRQVVIDDDMKIIADSIRQCREGRIARIEVTIRHKNSTLRHLQISATPYYDTRGVIIGSIGIFSDITDRISAEKEKARLHEQLERSRRMESLGVLAGGVAHDLNNILGPLVAYPEMILMKLPEDSPARRQLTMMGKCARDAAEVIQDLLTLARRGRYEMIPTDLNEVVEAYLSSVSFTELKNNIPDVELIEKLDPAIDRIMGSAPHLLKIIMNLVINAYDAMPQGGRLTIESSEAYLEKLGSGFGNISKGDYIILKIKDTGIGIDEKYLKHIFEPYYSKKEMGSSGSGLGLSVVYGILQDHKGYYDINSRINHGTEFILYFPACKQSLVTKTEQCGDYRGKENILIIDDAAEQREIATEILSNLGYQVETAFNGHNALEILREKSFDLIVLDMIMEKGFDGLDTYRGILNMYPGQKAVIVSGFSATDRVNKTLELGAGQYIKKPYTINQLGRAIREELNRQPAAISG
nr:PAS domain S-box protein [candidate division Zixibacteria bacterium]